MPSSVQISEAPTLPVVRPRIGMLWGDFPWAAAPQKLSKLLSGGVTARNLTRALNLLGHVVPYTPPPAAASPSERRAALVAFLTGIDVLWADVYPASAPALHLRRELGLECPAILFAGGAIPKAAEAMLFPWQSLLTSRDGLLFTCDADRAIWQRLVKWSALHEWVLPLPVDETVFYPRGAAERRAARLRHGLPPYAPLLLYVGRLNIQKNLHTLLHLLAAVRRAAPDAHLCIIGEDDDIKLGEFGVHNTGYVAWLRGLAGELGVADHVTWVGPLFGEDLARVCAAGDVLVNLSFYHRENFGLAQAEAQLSGIPVVCTAWGGFKDIVSHGATGYLVDAVLTKTGVRVDWAAGARHIVRLLQDPALWHKMSALAAARARERFTVSSVATGLANVLTTSYEPLTSARTTITSAAYEPSRFARRYEAHKRACGWYADATDGAVPRWYPPMFQGRDYALYETLIGPYATRRADELALNTMEPAWVPYSPSPLALEPVRRLVHNHDPVWPHRRFLTPLEWEVARRVDGVASIDQIVAASARDGRPVALREALQVLWEFHRAGLVLFQLSPLGG